MKNPINLPPAVQQFVEQHIYYIFGVALVSFFLLDYFFFMKPRQIDTLAALTPQIQLMSQDIIDTKNNIQQSDSFQIQIKRLKEQLQKLGYKIPIKEEVSQVLDGISRLANQNKIRIDQMIPGKGVQEILQKDSEGKYYVFPISVEASGGYHDIGRFIDQIEKDEIFKSVANLTMEASAKDPMHQTARLTITTIILEKAENSKEDVKKP